MEFASRSLNQVRNAGQLTGAGLALKMANPRQSPINISTTTGAWEK
jgi:hypothetical protein